VLYSVIRNSLVRIRRSGSGPKRFGSHNTVQFDSLWPGGPLTPASLTGVSVAMKCAAGLSCSARKSAARIPRIRRSSARSSYSFLTIFEREEKEVFIHFYSVADPDPGSGIGCFLTPGSGIRNRFFPEPGPRISDPGSQDHIFKSFLTIFLVKSSIIL